MGQNSATQNEASCILEQIMNNVLMGSEIARARELRRNMSEPEVILWSRLRRLRQLGFPIRRQFPFKGYFFDFACLSRRLVIEVDGFQHSDDLHAEHDFVRDKILGRADFRVIRFPASEVRRNLNGVMDQIIAALEAQPDIRFGRQSPDPVHGPELPHPGDFVACPSP
jgi:very-short-patch-repair endonuclease